MQFPTLLRDISTLAELVRHLGARTLWNSLLYRRRYARWQHQYGHVTIGGQPEYLGDLVTWSATSGHSNAGVDLRCTNGVLRVEFLAEGICRVRLSRSDAFPATPSFAVSSDFKAQQLTVPPAAAAPNGTLRQTGPGLSVEISSSPCRLCFSDNAGRLLLADADGAGWQGTGVVCAHHLAPDQLLFGLGEKTGGLILNGQRFEMWNRDPSGYGPGSDPIYQSIPFIISLHEGVAWGVLFDNTYRSEFDLGYADKEVVRYQTAGGELNYYILAGPNIADVLARYADLTGHLPLPPRWSLGYHQSRWSYGSEAEVREVAHELRERRIPCDAIHLDIDYMRGYRVFTWHPQRFPEPARLLADLRREGLRTVAIVDPGVKVDAEYSVCADGLKRNAFCTLPGGFPIAGPVWPGECYFPDFADATVCDWWGEQYRTLLNDGVEGFWNDMNEPAIFFGATLPDGARHQTGSGDAHHAAIHNVYGLLMAQAGYEGLNRLRPDERPFLISRAAYAGIQRYACVWTGDNQSTWDHLRLSIPMVLGLGLSGQPFAGPDTGGFAGDCDGELLTRWTQVSALLPLFRNHTALGTAHQEPWAFGQPYEDICRRYIELRYRLLPYLYTAFWEASTRGLPVVRPLALSFPGDKELANVEDEFMVGSALLAAPVVAQGAAERTINFPSGIWYDFWSGDAISGPGLRTVPAPLDTLPLYARAGSVVPLGPVMQHTEELVPERLELHVFPGSGQCLLYEDDGHSNAYRKGAWRLTQLTLAPEDDGWSLARSVDGTYDPGYRSYDVVWRGQPEAGRIALRALRGFEDARLVQG